MQAKSRPPQKLFFSAKGRTKASIRFLTEPVWAQDEEEREVLRAEVWDMDDDRKALLEQFCPDAYDLSEAIVAALGTVVKDKSAAIVGRGAARKTNDGRTVAYLDGFEVKAL
jgi:hypothetical protein